VVSPFSLLIRSHYELLHNERSFSVATSKNFLVSLGNVDEHRHESEYEAEKNYKLIQRPSQKLNQLWFHTAHSFTFS
jgi:hypothetical protein